MNELTCNEIDEVSGGFPIAVSIVIALAGKFAAKGATGALVTPAGIGDFRFVWLLATLSRRFDPMEALLTLFHQAHKYQAR